MHSSAVPSTQAAPDDQGAACPGRRCVLVAATAGAAAVLTGCSAAPGQGQQVAVSPGSAGAPAAASGADAGMAAETGTGADGMDAMAAPTTAKKKATKVKGKPLAKLAAIPVGGGMVLPAAKLVVTRPTATTVKAFSAVCTHEGCVVNQVADGTINCPCHGARFDITTGAPVAGPARKPLTPTKVAVRGATVIKV